MTSLENDILLRIGKLEGVVESMNNHITRLSEQDKRLQELEKRQSWFMGILIVVGGIITFADVWFMNMLASK